MTIRALTIDFWNTMVVAETNGEVRRQARMEQLLAAVQTCRPDLTDRQEVILAAFDEVVRRFDRCWREQFVTPSTSDFLRDIWDLLELEIDPEQHTNTVTMFEEGILHGPPSLVEGLEEALAWAAPRYRLGVISDTMFSPGRVIKQLLDNHNLLGYFDSFVFSDEAGCSKPNVRAFEAAADELGVQPREMVHIGDLRRTDIKGARNAGAAAFLFTGVREDPEPGIEPDAILRHWRDLPEVLKYLSNSNI